MRINRALGPRICLFMTTLILILVMGFVVSSCLKRKNHQPYMDVCEMSRKNPKETP